MITSRLFRADHPSRAVCEVSTPVGQLSGLLTDSVVMTDNLATIFCELFPGRSFRLL
jgi:mRNA interferase MazF